MGERRWQPPGLARLSWHVMDGPSPEETVLSVWKSEAYASCLTGSRAPPAPHPHQEPREQVQAGSSLRPGVERKERLLT